MGEKTEKTSAKMSAELKAIGTVEKALAGLSPEARSRVLAWAQARFADFSWMTAPPGLAQQPCAIASQPM